MRFYGYINVLIAWLILVILVGCYYSIGVFAPTMGGYFGWSAAQFGAVLSVAILGWGITAPLVGVLVAKVGPRLVMTTGCFLAAASMTSMAFVNELWQFYVLVLPLAFGLDLGAALPALQLMSNWFLKRRATMIGLVMAGGGVGGLVVVPLARIMIDFFGTWRLAWFPLAAAAGIGGLLGLLFIRNWPEDKGQYVDGVSDEEALLAMTLTAEGGSNSSRPTRVYITPVSWRPAAALKTPAFWLIIAAMSGLQWSLNSIIAHQVAFFQGEIGLSPELAAATLGIVVGLSTVGRMLSGWLGDRIEPRRVMGVFLLASGLGVVLLLAAHNPLLVYGYVILFGIAYGGTFVPQTVLLANYFGSKNYATILGLQMPIMTLVGAISPVVAGLIKDTMGSYGLAWWIGIVTCLLGAICAYLARPPRPQEVAPAS